MSNSALDRRLSVLIVTKNEAVNIVDCVRSAAFADEVLVLDSGSTDDTAALAREAGAKVLITDWPGHGAQRNRGTTAAAHEWIFSLDADERITGELAAEIRTALAAPVSAVYDVPRRSLYVTRFMRRSGWWPDRKRRFYRRSSARWSERESHEDLVTAETVGHLTHPLIHYSFRDFSSVVAKINSFSSWGAQDLHRAGHRGGLGAAIAHASWAFFRTYILKLGLLDGGMGFVLAVSNAEGTFYKYLKLAELNGRLPR